jgi:hypothetical protein
MNDAVLIAGKLEPEGVSFHALDPAQGLIAAQGKPA